MSSSSAIPQSPQAVPVAATEQTQQQPASANQNTISLARKVAVAVIIALGALGMIALWALCPPFPLFSMLVFSLSIVAFSAFLSAIMLRIPTVLTSSSARVHTYHVIESDPLYVTSSPYYATPVHVHHVTPVRIHHESGIFRPRPFSAPRSHVRAGSGDIYRTVPAPRVSTRIVPPSRRQVSFSDRAVPATRTSTRTIPNNRG